jgi:hypothetical protein
MRNATLSLVFGLVLLIASVTVVSTRSPEHSELRFQVDDGARAPSNAPALADSIVLASYTFDDSLGGPDPQGWVGVDVTVAQSAMFHVDDFAGLPSVYQPLEGAQSLWCGIDDFPGCAVCPGYGNNWRQQFESVAFSVSGDVTVDYLIRYDTEPGYDYMYVEYLSKSDAWQTVDYVNGQGEELKSSTVPGDSLDGSVKLRFRFVSDGAFSDGGGLWPTDGAAVIDSLTVSDSGGVVDFQDFEFEAPGDTATADGNWIGSGYPKFGDFAALFPGTAVLQEDSLVYNPTHLWGFFENSPDDYACGGHPEQPAVPGRRDPGYGISADYIHNEIRSPFIDLSHDIDGTPVPEGAGGLILEFDVYRDLPQDRMVFYTERVRYLVDGEPTAWIPQGTYQVSPNGVVDWHRSSYDFSFSMVPGATHIQVAIGCIDLCSWSYDCRTSDAVCHSHSPLIDNVRLVKTVVDTIVVTNTDDSGAGSLRDAITAANADGDRSFIHFDIPGVGPHVIHLLTNLPPVAYPTVIDAATQPGYAGTPLVVIDGSEHASVARALQVDGNWSVVRGFEMTNCQSAALRLMGTDYAVVESNHFTNNIAGLLIDESGSNNTVGGSTPDAGNLITGNTEDGIYQVGSVGARNSYLSNSIYNNGGLGIDLRSFVGNRGVDSNDFQDPDTGPNLRQNFPAILWASSAHSTIGASLNSVPGGAYTVQFFSNPVCDASGYGEGKDYLGSVAVTTDSNGDAEFVCTTDVPFSDGQYITATATDASGNTSEFSLCLLVTPVTSAETENTPTVAALYQAVPNPFNPSTTIRFDVPDGGVRVQISVYDVAGRLVKTLVDDRLDAGRRQVTWDGRNQTGSPVASGMYFYRMTTESYAATHKMLLLK